MAITPSSQAITAGVLGTFGIAMGVGGVDGKYRSGTVLYKLDETLFDPTTLMPSSGGSVAMAQTPIAAVRSAALESNHVFKGSAGNLLDAYCLATNVSGFFMLFDAVSAPADGAVTPLAVVNVGAGLASSFMYPSGFPLSFATGLVGVFSTTGPFTKTASATAFLSARIQ